MAEDDDLDSDGLGERLREAVEEAAGELRDRLAEEADGDGEEGEEGGAGEGDDAGADEDLVMRRGAGGDGEGGGEEDGGGAKIEHALDGVDGDLRGDGELDAFGDEVGAGEIGETAEEGYGGEADELRADEGKRWKALDRGDEDDPAGGAEPEAGVDEGYSGDEMGQADVAELGEEVLASRSGCGSAEEEDKDGEEESRTAMERRRCVLGAAGVRASSVMSGWLSGGDQGCWVAAWRAKRLRRLNSFDDAARRRRGSRGRVGRRGSGRRLRGRRCRRAESERDVVVVAGEELVEVGGAPGDVLVGAEGVVDTEGGGGSGHELHEAAGSGAGDGQGLSAGFGVDDGQEEVEVDVVLGSGVGEEVMDAGCGGGFDGGCCRREGGGGWVGERLDVGRWRRRLRRCNC